MATLVVLSRPACTMSVLLIFSSTSEPCRTQSHFTYQCSAWLSTNRSSCRPRRRWPSKCWMMARMKCSPSTTESKWSMSSIWTVVRGFVLFPWRSTYHLRENRYCCLGTNRSRLARVSGNDRLLNPTCQPSPGRCSGRGNRTVK